MNADEKKLFFPSDNRYIRDMKYDDYSESLAISYKIVIYHQNGKNFRYFIHLGYHRPGN